MTPSGTGNNASRAQGFDLHPGQVVLNTWEVIEPLGRGGMGAVYRVYHRFLRKEMAMKTLRPDKVTEVNWKRFQAEARAIARLVHPNIIQIFDMGTAEAGQPFYTMELLDGRALDAWISDEPITPAQAVTVFRQVASALAFAHERGIIHRDIKPANIMLTFVEKNKPPVVKVVDFGIAKLGTENQALTKEGEVFGSPFYMSPEQANGQLVDQRSDIYSLGCALYETLTGFPPFKGKNAVATMMMHLDKTPPTIESVRSDLEFPEGLSLVVQVMLAKNPDERYSNASQLASDLLQIERGFGAKVSNRLTAAARLCQQSADVEEVSGSQSLTLPIEGIENSVREHPYLETEEIFRDSGPYEFEPELEAKTLKWPTKLFLSLGALNTLLLIGVAVAVTIFAAAVFMQARSVAISIESATSGWQQQERLNFLFSKRQYYYIFPSEVSKYQEIGMIFDEGVRYYHFSSLPNECVGDIGKFAQDGSSYGWRPAIGVVVIPEGRKIAFRPSQYLLAHPQLWQKFRVEDLQAISFSLLRRLTEKESRVHIESEKIDRRVSVALDKRNFQELSRFKALESLDFAGAILLHENTESLVETLNKLPDIKALTFGLESRIPASAIMNLNCFRLGKLTRLRLPPLENLSPLIASIGKSRSIESLSIAGCAVTLSDFEILAGISQLHGLDLQNVKISRGSIAKLSVLPKLKTLGLVGAQCPIEEAGELLKLRQLKTLWISLDVFGADKRLLAAVKKKLQEKGVTVNLVNWTCR